MTQGKTAFIEEFEKEYKEVKHHMDTMHKSAEHLCSNGFKVMIITGFNGKSGVSENGIEIDEIYTIVEHMDEHHREEFIFAIDCMMERKKDKQSDKLLH